MVRKVLISDSWQRWRRSHTRNWLWRWLRRYYCSVRNVRCLYFPKQQRRTLLHRFGSCRRHSPEWSITVSNNPILKGSCPSDHQFINISVAASTALVHQQNMLSRLEWKWCLVFCCQNPPDHSMKRSYVTGISKALMCATYHAWSVFPILLACHNNLKGTT